MIRNPTQPPVSADKREKTRAATVCVLVNLFLTVLKLVFGTVLSVPSLTADGFHSAADLLSAVIVLLGIRIASRAACDPSRNRRCRNAENVGLTVAEEAVSENGCREEVIDTYSPKLKSAVIGKAA